MPSLISDEKEKISESPNLSRRISAHSTASIEKALSVEKEGTAASIYSVSDDLQPEEEPPFKLTHWLFGSRKTDHLQKTATRRSAFDDPDIGHHYWPKKDYESYHRFDPKARWTFGEEKNLLRKIDWRVMLWAAISFSALNLDRNNLNQANTDNFIPDMKMTTDDYNLGNTVFHIAFMCAELPSQLVSKRIGPDRWIPVQICIWSIVSLCQFWINGRASFLTTRALLGFIQGGFIPDLILYLSYFYTKTELPFRLALFWMSSGVCSIIGSFIAVGVLRMRGLQGHEGWRWLFLIEGALTLVIGIITFFMMPPSATQTKTWFRPNGWFTEREEMIATTRILRDDPSKGDMHNREGLTPKRLWKALMDYDLWPIYIIGLMFGIPTTPPSQYLTLGLRRVGFNTLETNMLTIPSTVANIITMFLITIVSESVNDRALVAMAQDVWVLPFIVGLYTLPKNPNPWLYYGLASGLLAYPYTHPIQVAWASRNAGAVASRTVNASVYNMFLQASTVIASNIYRKDDAPDYKRGNAWLVGVTIFNIVILYPGTKLYYIWRNKQKAKIWDAMTPEEKSKYLETTTDLGNRRLDFKFAH